MNKLLATSILLFTLSNTAFADCVYGAKDKTSYVVLDSHTIVLRGGYGGDILIKTFAFINNSSSVTVLKDSFCSFESSVLYVDGQTVDANDVKKL